MRLPLDGNSLVEKVVNFFGSSSKFLWFFYIVTIALLDLMAYDASKWLAMVTESMPRTVHQTWIE